MGINKWAAAGCVFGLAAYLISCAVRRSEPDMRRCVESPLAGALIIAGAHLAYCVYWLPMHMGHIVDEHGDHVRDGGLSIQFGELHSLHIFVAGVMTVYMGIASLIRYCKNENPID